MASGEKKQSTGSGMGTKLSHEEVERMLQEIPGWTLKDNSIEQIFTFGNFREAMDFVNDVADIAESEDHHPDVYISYNEVRLELSTHKAGGLTKKDFNLASKIDKMM